MDHEHMDHGGHGNMPEPMCNMNMIFTWDTTDLCVVFRWWHIQTTQGLLLSLLAIVALGAGYEFIRYRARALDSSNNIGEIAHGQPSSSGVLTPLLGTTNNAEKGRIARAAFYAFQVFYSFFLMLIFMTYNGWAMLAVTLGAFLGFYLWGDQASRGMSCH